MAQGRDEHRMVFDIRGRRGVAIKVVYAILALLMVASLFLVTGAINLNTLFGSNTGGESAASSFQKQAVKIEAKLKKEPEDEDLLASLTRTRVNAANSMRNAILSSGSQSQGDVEELKQELAQVSEDWSRYTAAASEPSVGIAAQVSPALFQLAELASSGTEARENVTAAAEAQEIITEKRPSVNAWSTLSYDLLFKGDFKGAEEAKEETAKLSSTKFARENYENQYEETEKSARRFDKQLKLEKASKATESGGEGGGKNALETPALGGLGGTSLGGE
jgi:hypothetical protein